MEDPFFGPLRFMKGTTANYYYEGSGVFAPTGQTIEYFIDSDENGPSEAQREFYRHLQMEFNTYVTQIKPLIIDEFRN
ncbi:hypothetical protein [Hymenobacter canadensis]|uniref:Uncharacterized protein n=1 Tax=Hymenobacter canadensis TaxID=2999067 RepID=A0ABY7LUA1_9BACT|nr:hypothetical protein [Hymenobacter canadensis]WBA43982.1 hypothetical protein O3303_20675 [Hymenobacter canadensis]WBA44188.1 hypothetical protein O3303_20080 [Hymenobacter canadensis]